MLVWLNAYEVLDNRVKQADFFFFLNMCTVFTVVNACVRVLSSLK